MPMLLLCESIFSIQKNNCLQNFVTRVLGSVSVGHTSTKLPLNPLENDFCFSWTHFQF